MNTTPEPDSRIGAALVRHLLEDVGSGLRADADGRRFFRPRRVRFRTIDISAQELFGAGWLDYEQALHLPYGSENSNPSHREIREFATRASERFHTFWYRVFDVAVARALAGRQIDVFQHAPFLRPNTFFDIGIPDQQDLSSVPAVLHEKILAEYIAARRAPTLNRVYYLSSYLTEITSDLIVALEPYRAFWELKNRREICLDQIDALHRNLAADLLPASTRELLREEIDRLLLERLDEFVQTRGERGVGDAHVRKLIHRRRTGDLPRLNAADRMALLAADPAEVSLPAAVRRMGDSLSMLGQLRATARSAAGYSSAAYRIELRRARLQYLVERRGTGSRDPASVRDISRRRDRYLALFVDRLKATLAMQFDGRTLGRVDLLQRLASVRELNRRSGNASGSIAARSVDCADLFSRWGADDAPVTLESRAAAEADLAALFSVTRVLSELRRTEAQIVHYYDAYRSDEPKPKPKPENKKLPGDDALPDDEAPNTPAMYAGNESLVVPDGLRIGNPYDEAQILRAARELVFRRLRPVRRTANHYSLNPGHRHGAVTLNPVMKLWKERPDLTRDGPDLVRLEINTTQSVQCLLELAALADPHLTQRELRREKIVREARGTENLANLLVLLLPGSCYPLREVHRLDFPEFRGRVIGETRNPVELGVDPHEDSILTGCWYQKLNHSLYYPVGGDHGRLLRLIWNSGRSPGPPAFLFALGQFVHDCLEDSLVYYKTTEKTFRECVEDYYLFEDRIRKNRGELAGRRRPDNSRAGVRFTFAVTYARLTMEALTGSSQSQFRHPPTEQWMMRHLNLPVLTRTDRAHITRIREAARALIQTYSDRLHEQQQSAPSPESGVSRA